MGKPWARRIWLHTTEDRRSVLEYQQTGALCTVRDPRRVSNLTKHLEAWRPLGLTMHWLTGDEAHRQKPLLAPDVSAAIYAPEVFTVQIAA